MILHFCEDQEQSLNVTSLSPRRSKLKSCLGRSHGLVHVGLVTFLNLGNHLLRGRIDCLESLARSTLMPLVVDEDLSKGLKESDSMAKYSDLTHPGILDIHIRQGLELRSRGHGGQPGPQGRGWRSKNRFESLTKHDFKKDTILS